MYNYTSLLDFLLLVLLNIVWIYGFEFMFSYQVLGLFRYLIILGYMILFLLC